MATAGIHTPRIEEIAERPRGAYLTAAIKRHKPELMTELRAIDAVRTDTPCDGQVDEAHVLVKLAIYRRWLVKHLLPPPLNGGRPHMRKIMQTIGEVVTPVTDPIRRAIRELAEVLPSDGSGLRPTAPSPLDLLIDEYEATMRDRKHGLPRNGSTGQICWHGVAAEVGCAHLDINSVRKRRLCAIDVDIGHRGRNVAAPRRNQQALPPSNPAVPELLSKALDARRGRMPADPLAPHAIDLVTIAEEAGVTVADIVRGPDANLFKMQIEEARGGKDLVPHPLLSARRFTYSQLKEHGREARIRIAKASGSSDPHAAGRVAVRALTQFLRLPTTVGGSVDVVPLDFPELVRAAVASGQDFGSGWAAQMRFWATQFDELRSIQPLPEAFTTAIRILAAETGVAVRRLVDASQQSWIYGLAYPSREAGAQVAALEKMVRVLPGTLSRRLASEWQRRALDINLKTLGMGGIAHRLPAGLSDLPVDEQVALARRTWSRFQRQDTVFARRLSKQVRDRYRLKFEDWPSEMRDAWHSYVPRIARGSESRAETSLRVPGTRPSREERSNRKKQEDRTWTEKTEELGQFLLGFYFGFLVRSKESPVGDVPLESRAGADGGSSEAHPAFEPEPGLGLPIELIHPALLAVVDLTAGYAHWKRSRSGGRFAPTISLTMRHMAEFLKPQTGLVWKNPQWLKHLETFADWWDVNESILPGGGRLLFDIDAFRENWQEAVGEAYDVLIGDAYELKPVDPLAPRIRDAFAPIAGYLDADDPLAAYMVGVRQMLASKPLSMLDRHAHRRNCILTLIAVQSGLRLGNLLLTVSGDEPTLRREEVQGVVRWRIVIPASQFKNWRSPFFAGGHPYDYDLDDEDGLYQLLEDYMGVSRPYLLKGGESDALFISRFGSALDCASLSNAYRDLTSRFFVADEERNTGVARVMRHGLHAIRHVIATSLLKMTGDIYQAAHAIQDTTRTVERHYARFLPRDKAKLAREQMRKSRMAA